MAVAALRVAGSPTVVAARSSSSATVLAQWIRAIASLPASGESFATESTSRLTLAANSNFRTRSSRSRRRAASSSRRACSSSRFNRSSASSRSCRSRSSRSIRRRSAVLRMLAMNSFSRSSSFCLFPSRQLFLCPKPHERMTRDSRPLGRWMYQGGGFRRRHSNHALTSSPLGRGSPRRVESITSSIPNSTAMFPTCTPVSLGCRVSSRYPGKALGSVMNTSCPRASSAFRSASMIRSARSS